MPTEENEDIIDNQAKLLDINDCEFSIADIEFKDVEISYFEQFEFCGVEMFGGSFHLAKGMQPGGCSEFCVS